MRGIAIPYGIDNICPKKKIKKNKNYFLLKFNKIKKI